MTIPEAYAAHRSVIAWHETTSEDRLPGRVARRRPDTAGDDAQRDGQLAAARSPESLGPEPSCPRLALDFLPGVLCSAQMAVVADRELATLGERIAAGRAIQRVWLRATTLGLQMQPQYTPLVFARYVRSHREFTHSSRAQAEAAAAIASSIDTAMPGVAAANVAWLARIGPARRVRGRSLRLPLATLVVRQPPAALHAPIPR